MRYRIGIAAGLLAIGVIGWLVWRSDGGGGAAAQPTAASGVPAVPVIAAVAEARDMPVYVRGIGAVQAYNSVMVRSRVDGQIMAVHFTEGQEVHAGDLLFQIDPRPFEAALAQATANRERDQAQLVSAQADLQRYAQLVGQGYQSRQSYDAQRAQVAQLQAAIRADDAQIRNAQLNLDYAEIRSPIDGRTGARLVDAGNLVRAADNAPLVTVTQLHPIYVTFTVPQRELERIRRGQAAGALPVLADSESGEGQIAAGTLTLIDNQIDPATGTIRLKATFDNQDEALWPGAFVTLRLVVATLHDAVTVPARAVLRGPNGTYVYVIGADSIVDMRPVTISVSEDGRTAIESGVAVGEHVVVDGQYRLTQGSRAAIRAAAPTADSGEASR